MARVIGGVTSSHIPAVGNAIANGLTQDPYWKRFFDGYKPAQEWLQKHKPDVVIVVYNDHGLNFFLDKVPTFALGCADTYLNTDEGWALKPVAPFKGDARFSWHIAEKLVAQEFDICMWLVMRGALQDNVKVIHKHYHAPISNTGAGVLVLENTFI